ncbi:MAG: hypothetical protein ACRC3Y_11410 [Romboutsia sp.]|uniref:hypothetical protein n=1 Tax=Romboutsia sp. TaxID=1965302 RepID=UPI003F3AE6DF
MQEINISLNVADDNGNGLRKLIITRVKEEMVEEVKLVKPNVISRMPNHNNTDNWTNDMLLKLSDNLMMTFLNKKNAANELVENPNAEKEYFYIGQYALNGGGSIESTNISSPIGKLESDITICGLGYIASEAIRIAVVDKMEQEKKSINEIKLDEIQNIVVDAKYLTALPVRVFTKENKMQLIEKFRKYDGVTMRVVVMDNQYIDVRLDLNNKIAVIPEAVDITYYLINPSNEFILDLNAENGLSGKDAITKEYFLSEKRKIMHLSIGEGTTEYPVTYNRVYWDEQFKRGSDNGVGTALEVALSELRNNGYSQFNSRQSVMETYLDVDDRFYEDVKSAFEAPLKTQANEILKTLTEELSKAKKVDTLMVYGGGSIAMKPTIKPLLNDLCNRMRVKLLYVPTKYAVELESLGLQAILNKQ